MERCTVLAPRARRDAILHAIGEHDAGWAQEDAAPAVNPQTGAVADFVSVPIRVRHAVWPRTIAQLADDPWAAALVAHHALTAYDRFRSDAAWTTFFAEMESARAAMARASGIPLEELAADYAFVRLGDLISLAFCTGSTDEQQFAGWTIQLSGSRVVVTPDVFGGQEIPIEISAREIRQQRFQSDAELRDALIDANTTTTSQVPDVARTSVVSAFSRTVTLRGEVAGRRGAE